VQLANNDPRALGDVARGLVKMFGRDLTDAENLRIAQILVSEDPDLVKAAVTDTGKLKRLEDMVNALINLSTNAARGAVVLPTSRMAADETGSNLSGVLDRALGAQ